MTSFPGVHCCVIDPFTIKPLDVDTLVVEANRCGGKVLTVEDHYAAGGIGEAVSFSCKHKLFAVSGERCIS